MASVKMQYMVQSCSKCGKKLLEVPAGGTIIGSPLITCKKCGITYRTQLRVEWYKYEPKWMVFSLPLILAALLMLVGTIMSDAAIGIMAAIFGLLIGLCISGRDIIRMLQSKKRMRDANYLRQLLQFQVIELDEYGKLLSEIK